MRYLLSILTCLAVCLQAAALPKGFFAPKSVLAEGNWVKVTVDQTGIYEISYETLRNMGFSDPKKVGVYGRGGKMLATDFTTLAGNPNIVDDLEPVRVMHKNDKLFFYGEGVDTYAFRLASSYNAKGYFSRQSKNIYSKYGYYFLTDSEEPWLMDTLEAGDTSSLKTIANGVGYTFHEVDLIQNNSDTGQLFFGEKFCGEESRREWKLSLRGCIPGRLGSMECYFYVDRGITGRLSYGIIGSDDFASYETKTYSSTDFRQQEPYIIETAIPGEDTSVFVEYDTDYNPDIAHIDFWTLTYQRYLPTLRDSKGKELNQEYIAFPGVTRGKTMAATFSNAASMVILNVTDSHNPVILEGKMQGIEKTVKLVNGGSTPEVVVFDPLARQLQIGGYEKGQGMMRNQNLHEAVADGADLLIIYIPALKEQALRLAELHERYEGIKVVTASIEEVYNEFSQGIPDAMAYRSFVKAAYETDHPVKNLLLLGPITADYRGISNERNPYENFIAFQTTPMNQLRGSQNANDFYGMMDDHFSDSSIEKNTMQVGVGILPCRFPAEAETIIDKIEKYLTRTDFAYYSNRMLNAGGVGDNHTHDTQAVSIGTLTSKLENNSSIITPLAVDAYGYQGAHDKFFDAVEDGRLIVNYFGHGGPSMLNREGNFFMINDVFKLRNTFHPFIGFAGCEISNSDRGVRGLGEALVTSTQYGVIGTLLATRETWSGQNLDLFQTFMTNLYRNGSNTTSPTHDKPLTIGEVFARTKTQSTYNNELAYQLICDPALKFPVVTRNIQFDRNTYNGIPGEFNELSGRVESADGETETGYNGEIVIRLMEPYKQLRSQDLCSGDDPTVTSNLDIVYADTQVAMTTAKVENGLFKARIFIPGNMGEYAGQIGRLHACAYDPDSKIVAGSMYPVIYKAKAAETTQDKDDKAPVIDTFEYIESENVIRIAVHDDLALSFSQLPLTNSFLLQIDGVDNPTATRHEAYLSGDGTAFAKDVPLCDLAEGAHSAKLTVSDVAGNRTTKEIVFSYNPNRSKFAIELTEGAVSGFGTFHTVGIAPAKADIIIMDASGFIVYRGEFNGKEFLWNACDNAGNPVAPGLYKAYILEKGDFPDKGHSATIDVPVI